MWGLTQHQVNERETTLAVGALGALYVSYKLLSAVYKSGSMARAFDAQGLHRPKSTLPILGNTLDVMFYQKERLWDWMAEQSNLSEGKPWVLSIIGRPDALVVTSPEACEDIFKTQFDNFGRGTELRDVIYDIFGDGIAGVDGEEWQKQRRVASHLFSMKMLRDVMDEVIIEKVTTLKEILADCAKTGKVVPMKSLFGKFTSEVFTKIGFGVDLHSLEIDPCSDSNNAFIKAVDVYAEVFGARVQSPSWFWKLKRFLSVGDEGRLKQSAKVAEGLTQEVLAKSLEVRRQDGREVKRTDLLTLFVETNTSIDPKAVHDTLMSFLLASKDTTSFSLSWVLVNLNRYPAVPTMEELQKLPYLEAVVKESLRLHMTASNRMANTSTTLSDGTFVPEGCAVMVPMYASARVKTVWGEDAVEYKPERWIDATTGKVKPVSPFKFVTFGAGPRQCLGMRFALLQIQTTIAVLFSHFDLKTKEDPFALTYDFAITLPVKGALECTVHDATAPAF
ncbi:Cytochrome P450 [Phytophthora cinnamomi]|uniref:Cytochrome P450 n=1 Tax=Phytophthora cinnamomi TaxID=4785 RepID=UPI0035595552|nr:Cytochrome P450 [Phytophthora cinnamomi]